MRILFLTPQLPYPPRQGTQIRNFHLLKAAASAHQVDLVSFAREGECLEEARPLQHLCRRAELVPAPRRSQWARLRALATSLEPDVALRLPSEDFAAALRSLLGSDRYDLVQVAGIEMAGYISLVRAAAPRTAIVFDDHNAEYLLQARAAAVDARGPASWPRAFYSLVQWLKLRRHERRVSGMADAVLAVSEADAAALRRLGISVPPWVVPNGVDTGYYRPDWFEHRDSHDQDSSGLLFTGTMDFRPNVDAMRWFASAVLPSVAAQRPPTRLYVVGRTPSPSVLQLASRYRNVVVTGEVEDVRPYFATSSLFVAPIRIAGGVRLKILEALAMGLPVVATGMGAEGVDLVDGKEIVIADTAEQFASAVLRLLEDRRLRSRLAAAGRSAAERRFDWRHVAPRLLEAYKATRRGGIG